MMKQMELSQSSRLSELDSSTDRVDEFPIVTDPNEIAVRVQEEYNSLGYLLNNEGEAVVLVDVLCHDCPIIGVSRGFCTATGYAPEHMLGLNCRVMLHGVPEAAISKSARRNLRDYCCMSRRRDLDQLSEVTILQPNCRSDGSQFMNFLMVGRVMVQRRPYLLGIQTVVGEGIFVRLTGTVLEQVAEASRATFKRSRHLLTSREIPTDFPQMRQLSSLPSPGFLWFTERLQDHCLIMNMERTAVRREREELATNCLVFGNMPTRHTPEGLFFAVLVDSAVTTFEGLPLLGFTRRKPVDSPDLYPTVCRCLGSSILIGACGEAFARDQWAHFKIGFKPPPQSEVQSWSLQPELPPHKRRPPVAVQPGDIFGCMYTRCGHIQFWRNGTIILDFDVERPVDGAVDYYAVADVCLSASSLTILPMTSPRDGPQIVTLGRPLSSSADEEGLALWCMSKDQGLCRATTAASDIDAMVSDVVNNALVKKAIRAVVGECKFCVTIADPKGDDLPLIAVSETFESMTGYQRSEILGVNCRFLNEGCPISPRDMMGLRLASENGSAFTALLPNRKKSGEMFVNLLDLRGLTIAHHVETNEALWYLIGIQADVTGLAESSIPEDHVVELQELANMIRGKLKRDLSRLAVDGAEQFDRQLTSSSCSSQHFDTPGSAWKLLDEPIWTGGTLNQQAVLSHAVSKEAGNAQSSCQRTAVSADRTKDPLTKERHLRTGMLLMSVLAFFAGLLLGRGTRRV